MQKNIASPDAAGTLDLLLLCAGSGIGGMEQIVRRLAGELTRRRANVRVILPNEEDARQTEALFRAAGIAAERHPALTHAFGKRRLSGVPALRRRLRESSASVVNLHYGMNFPPLNDIVAARLAGKRCIVSLHSGGGCDPQAPPERCLKTLLSAALCSAVVAVSVFQAEKLIRDGVPRQKIRVIPNGAEPITSDAPTKAESRRVLGLPDGAFIVCAAARLTAPKNIGDLIRALAAPECAEIFLAVAGDGPERTALEAEGARFLPGRHRFLGRLTEVGPLYAASDAFALPSREESFGLAFAEAAHYGLPCVAYRVGGVPETTLHERTGLLTAPGDVAAFSAALARLRADASLRTRLGAEASRRAQSEFTVHRMTERYLRLFLPEGQTGRLPEAARLPRPAPRTLTP